MKVSVEMEVKVEVEGSYYKRGYRQTRINETFVPQKWLEIYENK